MKMRQLACLLLAVPLIGRAASGDLGPLPDPSWGVHGDSTAYVDFGFATQYATSAVLLPDGDVVAAGEVMVNPQSSQSDLAVVRFQADSGAPDPGFGGNGDGRVLLGLVPSSSPYLVRAADSSLLFVARQTNSAAVIGRLTAAGDFDPSFDSDGKKFISSTMFLDSAVDFASFAPVLVPLADGGMLVVATVHRDVPASRHCIGVMRLRADGAIDAGFAGGAGRLCEAPPYEGLALAVARSVAVAANGDLLIAGTALHSGGAGYDMAVLRLSPDGVRNSAFGEDGWAYVAFDQGGELIDMAETVAVDAQQRIVLGGRVQNGGSSEAAGVARLLDDGRPDPSFGQAGQVTLDLGATCANSNCGVSAIAIRQARILVAGWANGGSFFVMLDDDGVPNPRFGISGRLLLPNGLSFDVKTQGDYVYAVGEAAPEAHVNLQFAVARWILPLFRSGFE